MELVGKGFGARLCCYGCFLAISQPNGLTGLARRLSAGESGGPMSECWLGGKIKKVVHSSYNSVVSSLGRV